MPEACGLASEWRMVTGGTHEGEQWEKLQHGVDIKQECEFVKAQYCCMYSQTWTLPEAIFDAQQSDEEM